MKCPCSELFWFLFSRIRTEYGEIRSISPYSIRMRENTDQNDSKYRHFLCSGNMIFIRPFQPSVTFHIKNHHFENQRNSFYRKCNAWKKWDKSSLFSVEVLWREKSIKLCYFSFFIWATCGKASLRFSKASLTNQHMLFLVRTSAVVLMKIVTSVFSRTTIQCHFHQIL